MKFSTFLCAESHLTFPKIPNVAIIFDISSLTHSQKFQFNFDVVVSTSANRDESLSTRKLNETLQSQKIEYQQSSNVWKSTRRLDIVMSVTGWLSDADKQWFGSGENPCKKEVEIVVVSISPEKPSMMSEMLCRHQLPFARSKI